MWLLALFVAVPMIEIALFIQVGGLIGLWPTLGLVLLSALVGSWLVREQGLGALADLQRSMSELRDPTEPFAHGLMILFAGGSFFNWFPLRGLVSDSVNAGACAPLDWTGRGFAGNGGFDLGYCVTTVIPDYFWHLALPLTAMVLSAFATTTLLTKNSFLDEIRKQYVITARAKGLSERQVLYGHVFRNAMLIVIAGFPGAFISAFFTGSLLIEQIFSLDGLGLLGYSSVLDRDYPVVFANLYIMSLIGLVVALISDLTYTWIDPRIDFERRDV